MRYILTRAARSNPPPPLQETATSCSLFPRANVCFNTTSSRAHGERLSTLTHTPKAASESCQTKSTFRTTSTCQTKSTRQTKSTCQTKSTRPSPNLLGSVCTPSDIAFFATVNWRSSGKKPDGLVARTMPGWAM
ncbi:hypothetical protein B0I35DRAFT_94117 [Stachybotrys elegans]|uniref:Uncharacterized protein n=1 Tax=Stachybotrys elegans TaxID=80388 RepID=A0A8K0SH46_9HYPO|nr:hypothetical protein B0I35DRAFT_94117 [Stachybotrys elegans]